MSVVIRTTGFDSVIEAMDDLTNIDWDKLTRIIGQTVQEQTINHFREQGGPDGPWTPRRDNNPWPILIRSHTLMESITNVPGDMQVTIGAGPAGWYGVFHQEGIPGRLPPRPFLGLTASDKDELTIRIEDHISNLLFAGWGS